MKNTIFSRYVILDRSTELGLEKDVLGGFFHKINKQGIVYSRLRTTSTVI